MKKKIALILSLILIMALFAGCSKAVGGAYKLTKVTADGYSIKPQDLSMNISFTLEADGTGTALYNSTQLDVTWSQDGKTVTLMDTDEKKVLELTVSGADLILHDNGSVMVFERQKEED